MTNRNKNAKKPRLRFLDLSFEGREQAKRTGIDDGRRPHGGYRGSRIHPPSAYASKENQKSIREEIDQLLEDEFLEVHGSPSWCIEASKEPNHSGESPLFIHRFMSPGKIDNEYIRLNKSACSNPNKCQPPVSRDGMTYYRPNRTHQYLTATELKDQSQNEVNLKYGRPTRTTLLRARQRTNSAPVNSYEIRRENMKREDEIRSSSAYTNPKEFLQELYQTNGESYHSFITGARYNRAHCLDAKTLTKYGVYMPRNNPTACFVTAGHKLRDIFDVPNAPPDSPRSDVDEVSTPMVPRRPTTAPGYGRRHVPNASHQPKHAWGDENAGVQHGDSRMYEEVIFWPSGLNVKGRNLSVGLERTNSMPKLNSRLPSVHGISMERIRKSRDVMEEMSVINQPPPSPMATSNKDVADKSSHVSEERVKEVIEETKKEPLLKPKKPKPILVDRSVNVPSVSGDSHHWNDDALIVSACAVPHVKAPSEAGSGKTVSFQKDLEDMKGQVEEETVDETKTENESETQEIPTPQVTVSVNIVQKENFEESHPTNSPETEPSPIAKDEVCAESDKPARSDLAEQSELTLDNFSEGSQDRDEPQNDVNVTSNTDVDLHLSVDDGAADEADIDSKKDDIESAHQEENRGQSDSVKFFLTEGQKKVESDLTDIDQDTSLHLFRDDKDTPVGGNANNMAIPQVEIEEASVSDVSETLENDATNGSQEIASGEDNSKADDKSAES